MRPHSGSEQVPVRRRGFQPAGAQRRPPALPVQPLQRDEEADRGGRAAVLARDVQGGWAARLAASAPPPGCGVRWENGAGAGGEAARPSPCQSGGLHGRAVLAKAFNRVRSGTSTSSPPAPSCPPASSPVVPARSSGFSAAQSSGVQVWCLLLSGPLGQGLAACGLNGAGL